MKKIISSKKGFTLIELLAVIVIMGILMAVAIPSISLVITEARKDIYINSVLTFIGEAEKEVINSTFEIDDPDTTYYIHIANLVDDRTNWGKSGFAAWKDSYVVAAMDLDNSKVNITYYFNGVDRAGWKILLREKEKLNKKDIYQDSEKKISFRPIGSRSKVIVYDKNGIKTSVEPELIMSEGEAKKCFSFQYKSSTSAKITYYNTNCGTEITIPSKIEGRTVDEIHSYTFNNKGLTGVKIPSTIKTIGSRAFSYNKLTTVVIPSSVTTIGTEAFMKNSLTKINLDESLKTINPRAFQYNLLSDTIEVLVPGANTTVGACAFCNNNLPSSAFLYKRNSNGTSDYSKITGYIGDLKEFSNNKFVIPAQKEGVALKTISYGAFNNMTLDNWDVEIPPTVTSIESNAFAFAGIKSVNLNKLTNLKTIGIQAFYVNNLKTLQIPASVTRIDMLAFNNNKVTSGELWIYKRTTSGIDYSTIIGYSGGNRNNLTIPTTKNGVALQTLGDGALRYTYLTGTLTLPAKVKFIGSTVFSLSKLTKVDNGDGILTDGFIYGRNSDGTINKTYLYGYGRNGRYNVTVPNTVKIIGPKAFFYSEIASVTIPEGVTSIGENAFDICHLKGAVVIPSTVTEIGRNAFHKEVSWMGINSELTTIVNKTGKSFNWQSITGGPSSATFETGVVENWYGDITVTNK